MANTVKQSKGNITRLTNTSANNSKPLAHEVTLDYKQCRNINRMRLLSLIIN